MVKVRYSHIQSLDPQNIEVWLTSIHNNKFKELLKQQYTPIYYNLLFNNENLRDEVKLTILGISCELVEILDSLNLDEDTLLAAYYFPLIANGVLELKEATEFVNPLMYKILKGTLNMAQIDVINFNAGNKNEQLSSIRHLLLSMADDYRSIIIKLAERIVFLRSLNTNNSIDADEKVKVSSNILEVYSSLANRLGIGQLKWEIEDLCFKIINPDAYYSIVKSLGIRRIERINMITEFTDKLRDQIIAECKIPVDQFEVYGRPKHIYSIYRKMQKKKLQFSELFDLFAARVIVNTVDECYQVLSMIQADYEQITSEFTDYIANPKPNGYKSIHIIIKLTERFSCELQIRTHDMHNLAEVGVAAHWQYKEGTKSSNKAVDKIAWLRKLLDWQQDISKEQDPEVGEQIRQQLLNDRVYIFTPRGEVRDLPIGATPLDFAYSIHTDVGNRCVGAKVNNHIVNFSYELKTGDKVEILTQKEPNISRDWVNFVKTQRAKSKIQNYFSKLDREKHLKEGLEKIESVFNAKKLAVKPYIPALLKRFRMAQNFDELCINFGNGTLKTNALQVLVDSIIDDSLNKSKESNAIIEQKLNEITQKSEIRESTQRNNNSSAGNQIIIEGSQSVLYFLAKCCQPIPGDPIIGYITKGRGVSVHKSECQHVKHLIKTSPGRVVKCNWNANYKLNHRLRARIQVIALDRVGMLRDISSILSTDKVSILSFSSRLNNKTMMCTMKFEVEFTSLEVLNKVLLSVTKISGVVQAIRL